MHLKQQKNTQLYKKLKDMNETKIRANAEF